MKRKAMRLLGGVASILLIHSASADGTEPGNYAGTRKQSAEELEQRLAYIDGQLAALADFQIVTGMGPIGFRSDADKSKGIEEWVEVQFKKPEMIDQIVIVPTLRRSTRNGPQADAFPKAFQVVLLDADLQRTIVAKYNSKDGIIPRIAPLIIDLDPQFASAIRIEANELSVRAWDKVACLQLSELLVFSGNENIALHQQVLTSSDESVDSRKKSHLVDGFLPYIMGLKKGKQSHAFFVTYPTDVEPEIIIDLEKSHRINQINLHTIESSDMIPQTVPSDYAFPRNFVVDGSVNPDFSDAIRLFESRIESVFDIGPIFSERFTERECRFIRIRVLESYIGQNHPAKEGKLGFAEIEVLSNGVNIARGKPVSANIQPIHLRRTLEALTDGCNYFGEIVPVREWLGDLALRHELERERPVVEDELKELYARQKTVLNQLVWLVVLLIIIAVFLNLLTRLLAERKIQLLRERISADLHDELGANLQAIGLLSELSDKAKANPEKLSVLLTRIRNLTKRTGAAARHYTNILEAEKLYSDIAEHFQKVSRRLLSDLKHQLSIEGKEHLQKLSPRHRIDICLFYQECLTNILRHSNATEVETILSADSKKIKLTVSDNGIGMNTERANQIPKSISRRSRLLGSKLELVTQRGGGTQIRLTLSQRRFRFPKLTISNYI